MALNKKGLTDELKQILTHPNSEENNAEQAAIAIASAIDKYVRSGTVTGVCPPNGGPLTQGKIV